jgi:hypothetical protein
MERLEGDMSMKNPVTPPGIDPGTVRLLAQRPNHYTTPDPINYFIHKEKGHKTIQNTEHTKYKANPTKQNN